MGGYQVERLTMMRLDSMGQIISIHKFGNNKFAYLNNQFTSRFFYKQGNNIFTACCVRDSNNKYIGVLIKFDLLGDTLWQKIYRDSSMDVIPQMVTGSVDGGFLITGFFQSPGNNPCMLIKTDAAGNELWRKKVNKAGYNISDGRAILQDTATKRIFIAGYQYVGSASSFSAKDHLLITDSIGNKLVQKSYYSANSAVLMDLIQTKDKNIVAVGSTYKNLFIGSQQLQCSYILKLDINTQQSTPPIWINSNFDNPKVTNYFAAITELPNGDLLVGGVIDTLSIVQNWSLIRHSRLSSNGSILRQCYYDYKTNSPSAGNTQALRSLNLTSDGGWVVGIHQINFPSPNPLFYVKYDSSGCDSTLEYCANLTSILEAEITSDEITIFPNPFKSEIRVKLRSGFHTRTEQFRITNVLGKVLIEGNLNEHINNRPINLDVLTSGIYFFDSVIGNRKYNYKIVKE